MRYVTNLLIHSKQGYHLAKLRVDQRSPHYWCLRDIVVHCAVVFTHKQQENFLQPFIKLMYSPTTMKVYITAISVTRMSIIVLCCEGSYINSDYRIAQNIGKFGNCL